MQQRSVSEAQCSGMFTCIAMHACSNDLTQKPGLQCTAIFFCMSCISYMTYSNDMYQKPSTMIRSPVLYIYLYLTVVAVHACNNTSDQKPGMLCLPTMMNAYTVPMYQTVTWNSLHGKAELICSMHSSDCIWRMHILHLITQNWKASRSACIAIGSAVCTHQF